MHDDMKFEEFLRTAAKDYRSSSVPRVGEIWAAIEPDVAQAIRPGARSRSFVVLKTATWIGLGIAATLIIGVAVGRWTAVRSGSRDVIAPVAVTAPHLDDSASTRYARATANEHLAEVEVFLTAVRADLKAGRSDAERTAESRELLSRTRILLGSASNTSPEVRRLLEDLELLLAEIAALPPSRSPMDQKLLNESMRDGNVIPRIRATLPAVQAGT